LKFCEHFFVTLYFFS